jgi:glycosyltransferase involved in cell wall biosynthesis
VKSVVVEGERENNHRIIVIIPALNEEASIGLVLERIPTELAALVIVCDNASTDRTADVSTAHGAFVVRESVRGYGAACLRALSEARRFQPSIVVFIDADFSDFPEEMSDIVAPILCGEADMVIGSRALGDKAGRVERGAFLPQARFGNWLATRLIRLLWNVHFTDLGPFRAISWDALERLQMCDTNFGWTVEMQIKAAQLHLRCAEVPVSYRNRMGKSKITGTVKGTIKAGYKILWTIARYAFVPVHQATTTALPQHQTADTQQA